MVESDGGRVVEQGNLGVVARKEVAVPWSWKFGGLGWRVG